MSDTRQLENQYPVQEATPQTLLSMAIEKGIKPEELGKLLDIYQKHEADKAKKSFFNALSKFQKDCPVIIRTKKGWNDNYTYAPIEEIVKQVSDILEKHGFSFSFDQAQEENKITVTCSLNHSDGHSKCSSLSGMPDKSGGKNDIQAIASAVSYLRRYTFCGLTGIVTAETDDDAGSVKTGIGNLLEQCIKLLTHKKVKANTHFKEATKMVPDEKYLLHVKEWCDKIINSKEQKLPVDNPVEKKRKAVLNAIGAMKGQTHMTDVEYDSFIQAIEKAKTIKEISDEHMEFLRRHKDLGGIKKKDAVIKPPEQDELEQAEIAY